jgi:hypothetical protein
LDQGCRISQKSKTNHAIIKNAENNRVEDFKKAFLRYPLNTLWLTRSGILIDDPEYKTTPGAGQAETRTPKRLHQNHRVVSRSLRAGMMRRSFPRTGRHVALCFYGDRLFPNVPIFSREHQLRMG